MRHRGSVHDQGRKPAGGGRPAGVISAEVAALTEGVLKAMFMTKIRRALAVVAGLALAATAGLLYQAQAGEPSGATEKGGDKAGPSSRLLSTIRLAGYPGELAWSRDGRWLATLTYEKNPENTADTDLTSSTVQVWDGKTGKEKKSFVKVEAPGRRGIAFCPRTGLLTITPPPPENGPAVVERWDVERGIKKDSHDLEVFGDVPVPRDEPARRPVYSPDGMALAAIVQYKTAKDPTGISAGIRVWDTSTWKSLHTLEGHTERPWAIAYAPDGKTIATAAGDEDKTVRIWDLTTKKTSALNYDEKTITSLAFSPDGKTLLAACANGKILVWDTPRWAARDKSITGNTLMTDTIAFSLDGRFLVASGRCLKDGKPSDGEVRLLDARDGTVLETWKGTLAASFSPDRATLAVAFEDKTVKLLDVAPRR